MTQTISNTRRRQATSARADAVCVPARALSRLTLAGRASLIWASVTAIAGIWLPGCGDDSSTSDSDAAIDADVSRDARASDGEVPRFAPHACEMPVPEGLQVQDFRCGTLVVAADRGDSGGDTLEVEVAVLAAITNEPRPDPVVVIGGGPGATSLDGYLQTHSAEILAPLRATRDIVFFDQRGTGRSRPSLACPEHVAADRATLARNDSAEQEKDVLLRGFEQCHARLSAEGLDLSLYHSAAVVSDVVELMQALDYAEYNLYGISYGGRIAQVVLRDAPQRVRSAILDASVAPQGRVAGVTAAALRDALQRFRADCLPQGSCAAELEDRLLQAYAQLDEAPHTSESREGGEDFRVVWNGRRALTLVQAMLTPERASALPAVVALLASGTYDVLDTAAPAIPLDPTRATTGFYASVLCTEELPFESERTVAEATAGVRAELVEAKSARDGAFFLELCQRWPVRARPEIENEPVVSDIPSLILHGTYDAAVSPSASEAIHQNLERSQHFAFPGFGHGVLRSLPGEIDEPSCAQRMVLDFLEHPDAPVDGSCVDSARAR